MYMSQVCKTCCEMDYYFWTEVFCPYLLKTQLARAATQEVVASPQFVEVVHNFLEEVLGRPLVQVKKLCEATLFPLFYCGLHYYVLFVVNNLVILIKCGPHYNRTPIIFYIMETSIQCATQLHFTNQCGLKPTSMHLIARIQSKMHYLHHMVSASRHNKPS